MNNLDTRFALIDFGLAKGEMLVQSYQYLVAYIQSV